MGKNKFLSKIISAAASVLLLAFSMAPAAVSAATSSGFLDLTSKVVLKGHAFVMTELTNGYNILVDSNGYKYELNSTSVINTTGLYLYLENTTPAVVDSIISSGHLTIVAGMGELQVQPAAASAAVDVKSFKMMGLQSPAQVTIIGQKNIGLRSAGCVSVNGISRLTITGTQDGISTGASVKITNGGEVSATGVYGVGIRAKGEVWGHNNTAITAEATNGSIGIASNSFVKASKNSTILSTGLEKGIHANGNILSEYNSFVTGVSTSSAGIGILAEGYLKVDVNSCVDGTGAQYGILVYRNIWANQFSILNGTAEYGVGIRANNKSGYNKISNYTEVSAKGGEHGFYSGNSLVVESGSNATINATIGTALKLDKGYLTIQGNSAIITAAGVTGAVDISGKSKYAIIINKAATLDASSTATDSIAVRIRDKAGIYVGLGGIMNVRGKAGGIDIYYGTLYVDNGVVTARSSYAGTPIKATVIKKVNKGTVVDYRM